VAQKVQVTQVSDLDGGPADETVRFSLDTTDYEIDLSAEQAQEMRAGLAPFVGHARRKRSGRARRGKRQPSRPDLPDIRTYARARGYDINERGRVPGQIIAEYDALKETDALR